jgi:hypothetical protein
MSPRAGSAFLLCVLAVVACTEGGAGPLTPLGTTRSINGSYVLESLTIDGVELDIEW